MFSWNRRLRRVTRTPVAYCAECLRHRGERRRPCAQGANLLLPKESSRASVPCQTPPAAARLTVQKSLGAPTWAWRAGVRLWAALASRLGGVHTLSLKDPRSRPTLHSGGTSVSQRRCRGAEAPGRGSLWVGWGVDVVFSSLSLEHGRGLSRAQPGPVTCSAYSQFSSPSTTVLALQGSCPELALGEEVSPAAAMTRVTGAWGEASTGATAPDYGWKAGAQGGARAQGGCGQGPGAAGRCPGLAGVPCRLHAPCTLRSLWLVL